MLLNLIARQLGLGGFILTLLTTVQSNSCAEDLPRASSGTNPRRTQVVEVVDRVKSCIVNIHSEKTVADGREIAQEKDIAQTQHRVNGMGTGIVIDPRGYLITNYHVIDDVQLLRVRLCDGTSLPARVVAKDHEHDLAIVKVDHTKPLPMVNLGTSSDLMLAEPVIAIGNAFGYEHTVTMGIVSALKRDVTLNKEVSYRSLIQTSAAINPGNSGGPLLNVHGELIGVNVAIRAGAQNIAFALPIDNVLLTAADMLSVRRRTGMGHGLQVRDHVDSTTSPTRRWTTVERVEAGSPGELAGFKVGDVVEKAGDIQVQTGLDIERAFLESSPGAKIAFVGRRDREEVKGMIVLQPSQRVVPGVVVSSGAGKLSQEGSLIWKKFGVKLEPVTADAVSTVNKDLRGGMMITEVNVESVAGKAGFQRGDILIGLQQWETVSSDNVAFVLNHPDLAKISPIRFFLVRSGQLRRGWIPSFE
jgi:serine protease Do